MSFLLQCRFGVVKAHLSDLGNDLTCCKAWFFVYNLEIWYYCLSIQESGTMEETFVPFRGIRNDLQGRFMCYKQDWTGGLKAGFRYIFSWYHHITGYCIVSNCKYCEILVEILFWCANLFNCLRILAPTTYIFFASAIPVISFGEQLERDTGNILYRILHWVPCGFRCELKMLLISNDW